MVTEEGMVFFGSFSRTSGRMVEMSVVGSTVRRNWPSRLANRINMMEEHVRSGLLGGVEVEVAV